MGERTAVKTKPPPYSEDRSRGLMPPPSTNNEGHFSASLQPSSSSETALEESKSDHEFNNVYDRHTSVQYECTPNPEQAQQPKRMLLPPCLHIDRAIQHLLTAAATSPPVTTETLSELDLTWIMNNVSLRCDVNYDHDLHFMPITGKRGEEKRKSAEIYWLALKTELRIYLHNIYQCHTCSQNPTYQGLDFPQRLPDMFENLRSLLETLVPDRDHEQVHENVDVAFLMQQVSHGVFDAARMSSWLAKLLKTHCAPMRDEWADAMSRKIEEGAFDLSMTSLVDGLQKLFSFLEAMKLDVANHQIRTLRYWLIDDTVAFQKEYFKKRIMNGKLLTSKSRDWYDTAAESYRDSRTRLVLAPPKPTAEYEAFASFNHGLTRLCKSNPPAGTSTSVAQIPQTLHYDRSRIQQLRDDAQDWIYLRICLSSFDRLTARLMRGSSSTAHEQLRSRLLAMTDGEAGKSVAETWQEQIGSIGMEVTRLAYTICRGQNSSIPDEEFVNTAQQLRQNVECQYAALEEEFLQALEKMSGEHACVFQSLSALQMSEAQREWQFKRQTKGQLRQAPDIEDMAKRLAHIGVLHWQIWSELVYLDFDDGTGEDDATIFDGFNEPEWQRGW